MSHLAAIKLLRQQWWHLSVKRCNFLKEISTLLDTVNQPTDDICCATFKAKRFHILSQNVTPENFFNHSHKRKGCGRFSGDYAGRKTMSVPGSQSSFNDERHFSDSPFWTCHNWILSPRAKNKFDTIFFRPNLLDCRPTNEYHIDRAVNGVHVLFWEHRIILCCGSWNDTSQKPVSKHASLFTSPFSRRKETRTVDQQETIRPGTKRNPSRSRDVYLHNQTQRWHKEMIHLVS